MRLELNRWAYSPKGTFGTMRLSNGQEFYTIERPWMNNAPGLSCVPEGRYELHYRQTSTSIPDSWNGHSWYLVGETVGLGDDDKPRSRCCIHIANTMEDVKGCIGMGTALGSWQVSHSRKALIEFMPMAASASSLLIYRGTG
jgi:hypothetical protein